MFLGYDWLVKHMLWQSLVKKTNRDTNNKFQRWIFL